MRRTRTLFLCGILGFVCIASPAMAGCGDDGAHCWRRAHHAIYHMENHIAYLEADPNVDEGYKGPIISKLHRKTLRIRSAVGPRWPYWPTPCCYSRRPIYIH